MLRQGGRQVDQDAATLTIETHIMVGEDGWAVPFGRAPDHHMQKSIRRLDVMFLWETDGTGHSGSWRDEVVKPLAKAISQVTPTQDKLTEPRSQRCSAQGQSPDSLYKPTCPCLALHPACHRVSGGQFTGGQFSPFRRALPRGLCHHSPDPTPTSQPTRCAPFLQNGLCHAT
jgi:hypothetical protein